MMRIRRNARIADIMDLAGIAPAYPPEMLQTHVCELNQSPWPIGCGVLPAEFSLSISVGKSGEFRLYWIVLVLYFCRSAETLLGYDLFLPAFFGVRVFSLFPPLGF